MSTTSSVYRYAPDCEYYFENGWKGLERLAKDVWNGVKEFFLEIVKCFAEVFGCDFTVTSVGPLGFEKPVEEADRRFKVDPKRLIEVPPLIDVEALRTAVDTAEPPILNDEFIRYFRAAARGRSIEIQSAESTRGISATVLTVDQASERLQTTYVRGWLFAADHRDSDQGRTNKEYARCTVPPLVGGIILELRKGGIRPESSWEMWVELVKEANACVPGVVLAAERAYKKLSRGMSTIEEFLLQVLEDAKADLFANFYTRSLHVPQMINMIRMTVGKQVGLRCDSVHENDPHIQVADAKFVLDNKVVQHTTEKEFLGVFRELYTPAYMIRVAMMKMNERIQSDAPFTRDMSEFFANQFRGSAEEAGLPMPYQDENTYELTEKGVEFLLEHFGFLERTR